MVAIPQAMLSDLGLRLPPCKWRKLSGLPILIACSQWGNVYRGRRCKRTHFHKHILNLEQVYQPFLLEQTLQETISNPPPSLSNVDIDVKRLYFSVRPTERLNIKIM